MTTATLAGELRETLRGDLIEPGDTAYDDARTIYNAMIDKRPAAIARCADVADVIAAVERARDEGLPLAIRGGGHNGPGLALCDDGLVIDLSRLRGIRVDPGARTVRVGGGCTWGDVDHATHAFGLATPSGIISTTGVGGLTLGGGHGYLTRRYGLTIDNLLSADVVLADGRLVTASADDHPDLFWALRGGGGNFGVVTSFQFRLHPVDTVFAGPMMWRREQAREVMAWYRDFIRTAPDDVYGWFGWVVVPPAPEYPEELHGETMAVIVWCHTGPHDEAAAALDEARRVAPPAFEHVGAIPYPALQSAFDELYPPGLHWYWKGDFVTELPDAAIEAHLDHVDRLPTELSTMHLYPINGAVHRKAPGDTAWSQRDATWSQVIVGVERSPEGCGRMTRWARDYWSALHPHSAGGGYLNFMMEEGADRLRETYRGNYDRLVRVKTAYDPGNLFRVNQNIPPAA